MSNGAKLSIMLIVVIMVFGYVINAAMDSSRKRDRDSSAQVTLADASGLFANKNYDKARDAYAKIMTEFSDTPAAKEAQAALENYDSKVEVQKKLDAEKEVKAKEEAEEKQRQAEEKRRQHEEAIKPPLQLVRAFMHRNIIDNPEAGVVVKNISGKAIDAYNVKIYCYNNYGDPVKRYGVDDNVYGGISQNLVPAGGTEGSNYYWTLHGLENTTNVEIVLTKAHYVDGGTWEAEAGQRVSAKAKL